MDSFECLAGPMKAAMRLPGEEVDVQSMMLPAKMGAGTVMWKGAPRKCKEEHGLWESASRPVRHDGITFELPSTRLATCFRFPTA